MLLRGHTQRVYTLTELVSTLDGLENKNKPPKPDIPVPGGDFNADTATEILPNSFMVSMI